MHNEVGKPAAFLRRRFEQCIIAFHGVGISAERRAVFGLTLASTHRRFLRIQE
jgi:hypothetical protein